MIEIKLTTLPISAVSLYFFSPWPPLPEVGYWHFGGEGAIGLV
ncbi:hypothetical protein [Pedobacter aquatilis]|nr:hypothetical protein [Pedobacter aquatilis]